MKHTWNVTLLLIFLFLISNLIGLFIVKSYVGNELPLNIEKPNLEGYTSFIVLFIAVIIATCIALILAKYKFINLWRYWYLFGVILCLTIAFGAFIGSTIALIFAIILGILKVFKNNFYIHNLTEVFVYGGLISFFAESFNVVTASALLILISIYDWVAVNKIKHMVTLAKNQSDAKIFAGLCVPYHKGKKIVGKNIKLVKKKVETAILGGGDIGFPLLFSSAVMMETNLFYGFLVSIFGAISLLYLFYKAEKNKFYPAMPFLTVGCFVGYFVVRLFI